VQGLRKELAVELSHFFGDVLDEVHRGVALDAVVIAHIVEALLEAFGELLHSGDGRIDREADVATHAFGCALRQLDDLLTEQGGLADERGLDALLPGLAQESRALLFVQVDEDRVRIGGFDLDHVGGEIGLAGLRGNVRRDFDVACGHFLDEGIAPALAEIVVHPKHGDGLRLDAVANVVGDFRHAELLAERGAEDVRVALLGDCRSLAADDLRNLRLLGQRHIHQHGTGEHRPQNNVRIVVEHFLDLGAGDACVALGIQERRIDLAAKDSTLGVDLVDRQQHAVAEVGAGDSASAGQFEDGGDVDGRLGKPWARQAEACQNHRRQ